MHKVVASLFAGTLGLTLSLGGLACIGESLDFWNIPFVNEEKAEGLAVFGAITGAVGLAITFQLLDEAGK